MGKGKDILLGLIMVFFFAFLWEGNCKAMGMADVEAIPETVVGSANDVLPEGEGSKTIITNQFNIRIDYGLNGIIRSGVPFPISVSVTNLGEDFEGILRIVTKNVYTDQGGVAYDKDLALAKGISKTLSFSSSYSYGGTIEIRVEIVDRDEKVLLSERTEVESLYYDYGFIGILSDDFTALNYLDGVEIETTYGGIYKSFVVELETEDILNTAAPLSVLNYLVINSFDTSKLSATQYEAIKEWVSMGGILIVGTGPDASQTLAMFTDDFLEGSVGDLLSGSLKIDYVPISSGIPIQESMDFTKENGFYEISLTDGLELNDGRIQYDTGDVGKALIQKKNIGKGAVVVTGFNLGLDPIDTLSWKDELGYGLLNDSNTTFTETIFQEGLNGNSNNFWTIYNLLGMLFNVKVPNIAIYALFFLAYVLIAGPIGYLILKAIDKREVMWIILPGCALVFTLLIAVLSIPSRITKPVVSHFTTLEIQDGVVEEDIFVALQTPDTKRYTIQLNNQYKNFMPLRVDSSGIGGNSNQVWDYRIKETAEGYQVVTNHDTTFTTDYMMFEDIQEEKGSFDIQIEGTTMSFSGSVTNNTGYDIEEAIIGYNNNFVYIGNFAHGETKTFTEGDVNFLHDFNAWVFYDYFESNNGKINRVQYAYDWLCEQYNYKLSYNQGIVMGYIGDYEQDIVTDIEIEESGAALIYQAFTHQPEDIQGTYIQRLFDYVVDPDYNLLDFNDNMMYATVVECEFSVPINSITKIMRYQPNNWNSWYEDVVVSGYNYETQNYELLFADGTNEMNFKETCPYIDKEGNMKLRFECTEPYNEFAPEIALID